MKVGIYIERVRDRESVCEIEKTYHKHSGFYFFSLGKTRSYREVMISK